MKLSLATLSLAFAAANASSLRLQKAVADSLNEANKVNHKHLYSNILLQGTTGEPTEDDLEFVGKALIASYNDVHWEVGHFMSNTDASVDFSLSTRGAFQVQTPVLMWGLDDAMGAQQSLLLTAISEDCAGLCNKEATAELEVKFCDRVKSSQGSKYLSSTTTCSISFDTKVDMDKISHSSKSDSNNDSVATLDTTIVLKGVGSGETTQEEQAILAKAFVAAYNDVHWNENHFLEDAEIPFIAARDASDSNTLVFDVVTPILWHIRRKSQYRGRLPTPTARWGEEGMDDYTAHGAGLLHWDMPWCRWCPDDDAMNLANFDVETFRSNNFDKEAIEAAFCKKIQGNSVSDKLASAESCSLAVETIIA